MAAPRMWLVGALVAAVLLAVLGGARTVGGAERQGSAAVEGQHVPLSEPTAVSLARGSSLGPPAVVSDPVVGALAVWPRGATLEYRVMPPGGVWQPAAALPRGRLRGQSDSALVASDGHGRITAAWVVRTGRGTSWLVTARRLLNGEWSTPKVMDEFVSRYEWNAISTPSLVMGGDGSTVLTWVVELTDPSDEGSRSMSRLHAMYRPPHSHWQPIRFASAPGRRCRRRRRRQRRGRARDRQGPDATAGARATSQGASRAGACPGLAPRQRDRGCGAVSPTGPPRASC